MTTTTSIPSPRVSADSQVYVIVWGNYVKVGCSVDPYDRLQRVTKRGARPPRQNGEPRLIATVAGGLDVEAWMHIVLREHRATGEWFHLRGPVKDLVDFVQTGSNRAFPTHLGKREQTPQE